MPNLLFNFFESYFKIRRNARIKNEKPPMKVYNGAALNERSCLLYKEDVCVAAQAFYLTFPGPTRDSLY